MRWVGHVVRLEEKKNAYRLLVRKSEGKRPLTRPRRGWLGDIEIDLREIRLRVLIGLVWERMGISERIFLTR
jgi:hypothetical protein